MVMHADSLHYMLSSQKKLQNVVNNYKYMLFLKKSAKILLNDSSERNVCAGGLFHMVGVCVVLCQLLMVCWWQRVD